MPLRHVSVDQVIVSDPRKWYTIGKWRHLSISMSRSAEKPLMAGLLYFR